MTVSYGAKLLLDIHLGHAGEKYVAYGTMEVLIPTLEEKRRLRYVCPVENVGNQRFSINFTYLRRPRMPKLSRRPNPIDLPELRLHDGPLLTNLLQFGRCKLIILSSRPCGFDCLTASKTMGT